MSLAEVLQGVSTLCAIIAAGCAIAAWRRASPARAASVALVSRVEAVERHQALQDERIEALRIDIEALPTRADLAELKGEVATVAAIASRTENAVNRLDDYLRTTRP